MGEFGTKFRQAREKKNLSLDDVSNVTKIGTRMLKAIEEEHFDQLPGGVFNKGFIRAYAKHLGLDADEAVTDYLVCLREAQIGAQEIWDTVRPDPARAATAGKLHAHEPRKTAAKAQSPVQVEELPDLHLPRVEDVRPPRGNFRSNRESAIPWTIIAAGSVVIVLAVFLWMRHSHAARHSSAPVIASANMPAPPPAIPTGVKTTPSPAPSQSARSTSPSPPAKLLPKPSQSAAAAPALTTSQTPTATKEASDATIRSVPASISKPAEKPSLTLVIRASETSWISVQSDGQLVAQETLIAPAATSYHASRELVIRVGNAAGVSFLWNGEELPPQGAEAEAKTFVFDAHGMRALVSDQTPH